MTRVAIVVPTFNSALTLGETLRSVLAQGGSLEAVEAVYLSDDGSTDDTLAVAAQTWPSTGTVPLRLVGWQQNIGPYANFSRAIDMVAVGVDWVLLLHSDDLAKPDWLDAMLARIAACGPRVGSICSSWDTLREAGAVTSGEDRPSSPVEVVEGTPAAVRGTLMRGCWWHISGCAIRVATFLDVGRFDASLRQMGDWEWLLRMLARGWAIEYVPRSLIVYRQHEATLSSASLRRHRDVEESLDLIARYRGLLSRRDVARIHAVRATHVARRVTRAVLRADFGRCTGGVRALGMIAASWKRCWFEAEGRACRAG